MGDSKIADSSWNDPTSLFPICHRISACLTWHAPLAVVSLRVVHAVAAARGLIAAPPGGVLVAVAGTLLAAHRRRVAEAAGLALVAELALCRDGRRYY